MPHTSYARGTHVYLILRDGTRFDDKYVENHKDHVVLVERGRVSKSLIRAMGFHKPRNV